MVTEIIVLDRNRGRLSVEEDKRFRVLDYGENIGTFDAAKEVWEIVSQWDVGRDRIYDGDTIVSREQIRLEMDKDRPVK